MAKVDFNVPILSLSGKDLGATLGETLVELIESSTTKKGFTKLIKIAFKLLDNKPFDITEDEGDVLMTLINDSSASNVLLYRWKEILIKAGIKDKSE